jgi:acetyl esterase
MVGVASAASLDPAAITYRQGSNLYVFSAGHGRQAPAVLLFHPGGWTEGEPKIVYDVARAFAAQGAVAIAAQYRLSGENTTPVDSFADTCAAFAYVRQHADELGIDPMRIAGYGESAGGQLVALAATRGCPQDSGGVWRPKLLMLQSPALDPAGVSWFPGLMKGAPIEPLSPLAFAGHETPPTLIIQGEEDTLTPVSVSRRFCAKVARPHVSCTVVAFPKVGHYFTRTLEDQDGQFNPFATTSTAEFVPDKRARAEAIRAFTKFLTNQLPRAG